jgi:molybdopterin-binding protein
MSDGRRYTASEAARALGISLDTLRRWDRAGRIRVERDAANRRVVTAAEVDRIRGERSSGTSARNRFPGVVSAVRREGLLTRVEIDVTEPTKVVAIITTEAADEMDLRPGAAASAIVKATSVMVGP